MLIDGKQGNPCNLKQTHRAERPERKLGPTGCRRESKTEIG